MSKVLGDIREAWESFLFRIKGMGVKKLIRISIPYITAAYIGNKMSLLWRHTDGTGIAKALAVISNFGEAFRNPVPSIALKDILAGIIAGIMLRFAVYYRSMTMKKYRHGIEYGSARWSA